MTLRATSPVSSARARQRTPHDMPMPAPPLPATAGLASRNRLVPKNYVCTTMCRPRSSVREIDLGNEPLDRGKPDAKSIVAVL